MFQGLSKAEREAIEGCLKEKTFQKGEILFSEGAPCEKIFIVREGRVKFYRTASSGREQILEVLNPGETCACNPGIMEWFCSASAEAVTPCRVWYISRQDYIKMVQTNLKVAQALNRLFAEKLQSLSALVEEVSLKDTKKRLVKFLLDMLDEKKAERPQGNSVLFIPFTREEIAQRLGTARETVARNLSQLKQAGLIDIKPYQIVILDNEGLGKLLQKC